MEKGVVSSLRSSVCPITISGASRFRSLQTTWNLRAAATVVAGVLVIGASDGIGIAQLATESLTADSTRRLNIKELRTRAGVAITTKVQEVAGDPNRRWSSIRWIGWVAVDFQVSVGTAGL